MPTMTCEKCKKGHATYHLTSIENGQKKEAHLCEGCARETGVGFKLNFSIGDLLGKAPPPAKPGRASKTKCPTCGMTVDKLKQSMRVGCANDYEFFRDELGPLLKKIHGSAIHVGKTPGDVEKDVMSEVEKAKAEVTVERREADLAKLRKDLDTVVKSEKYEEAAKLRDQIRSIEKDKAGPQKSDPEKPA
jgi:protein arginine kinase activator